MSGRIPKEDLLEDIRRVYQKLGSPPSEDDYSKYGKHSPTAVRNAFGKFTAGRDAANLPEKMSRVSGEKIPQKELIDELRRLDQELDRSPRTRDMDKHGQLSNAPYLKHFGSWRSALQEAGIKLENAQIKERSKDYNIRDLINEMIRLADVVDRPPYESDMDEMGEFSALAYQKLFGSWSESLAICGFPPRNRGGGFLRCLGSTDYGINWVKQREKALSRDRWRCQDCGMRNHKHKNKFGTSLHVHHIVKKEEFDNVLNANIIANLISLCENCHRKWENLPSGIDVKELVNEIREEKEANGPDFR